MHQKSPLQMQIPRYDLPEFYCSAYVRLAAKDLFNKNYALCSAWDRVYLDRVVMRIDGSRPVHQIVVGVMIPGMILGCYYPRSIHNDLPDMNGNKREFTHVALYLGMEKTQLWFAHQYERFQGLITLDGLLKQEFLPKVILDENVC